MLTSREGKRRTLQPKVDTGLFHDRYGNRQEPRLTVTREGHPCRANGYQSLTYDTSSNRITSAGFNYDPAGNQLTNGTGNRSFMMPRPAG